MDSKLDQINSNPTSPNLYSLMLSTNEKESFLESFNKSDAHSDDDFSENYQDYENGYFFTMDPKLKQERDKRLNEKDKTYKIKKHYFLKKSYSEMAEKEIASMKLEMIKEKIYLDNCAIAEEKLRMGKELNMNDVYYIFKRNFPLFNEKEKKAINHFKNLHFAFELAAGSSSIIIISYIRSIMRYFNFEILGRRYLSNLFLGLYGFGIYFSIMHFVDITHLKKIKMFYFNAKDRILDSQNEIYKTPYDEDENTYKAEDKLNAENIFKF